MKFARLMWRNPARFVVAMAALLAIMFAWPQSAQAQIIYTPVDIVIRGTYNLDLNNDGITDATITDFGRKTCNCRHFECQFDRYVTEARHCAEYTSKRKNQPNRGGRG